MIRSNSMSFFLHTIVLLFFSISSFLYTCASLTRCLPDQRDALVEFKNEFELDGECTDDNLVLDGVTYYPKTKSWANKSDCCSWDGITCDAKSGDVTGVDLSCSCLYGYFKPNSSLFRLRQLRNLNLAYNDFNASPIPTGLDKLMWLERLNFSYSSFSGQIPAEILHLTKLVSLDLSSPFTFSQSLLSTEKPFLSQLARNLTNLIHLDMSYVSISSEIPQMISNLTSLRSIHLNDCHLLGRLPRSVLLSPTIQSIDLGNNPDLESSLPEFNGNNSLVYLDLSKTSLSGNIPDSIGNLKHLNVLRFHISSLTGKIPSSIGNLSHLNTLYLHSNNFVGTLPSTLFTIPSLDSVNLNDNQLNGPLEIGNITSMSKLRKLDLSYNNFTGPIPRSISKLVNLVELDLSNFNTQGPIDFGIFWHLKSLEGLTLCDLNTNTTIDLSALLRLHLKSLSTLHLSGNHVSPKNMSSVSILSSQLQVLILSGCGITGFPRFIRTQQHLITLDLSDNKIKGQVPGWLWRLPELTFVVLSNNTFSGFKEFPKHLSRTQIRMAYLNKNNISGELPRSICAMTSLRYLDLSSNNLHGSVPQCFNILIKRSLSVLDLGNNRFSGKLPDIFLNGSKLRSLDVGHNQMVGRLPRSLSDCSSLEVLNLEHNRINDTFPFWLESLQNLQVLFLGSNEFHGSLHPRVASWFPQLRIVDISHNAFTGTLPSDFFMYCSAMHSEGDGDGSELKYIGNSIFYHDSMALMNKGVEMNYAMILKALTAIDLSGNRLRGGIPESIGLLKGLHVLNLSSNGFTGEIPSSMANLTLLESLDLSQNKLSGQIPPDLAHLNSLSIIRVSHNKLVGMIPKSTQFQTQDRAGFEDNSGLCGPPLDECGTVHDPPISQQEDVEEEEEVLSWIAAAIGFTPGIVLGLTIGYFMLSYKPHWFTMVFNINNQRRRRTR